MSGPVSWESLIALLTLGGAAVVGINAIVVRYFTDRSKVIEKVETLITGAQADWDKRHEVHRAEVNQAHKELHERIGRTNDRVLETERRGRDETAKAIREVEQRLGSRMEALGSTIRELGKDILTAVNRRNTS